MDISHCLVHIVNVSLQHENVIIYTVETRCGSVYKIPATDPLILRRVGVIAPEAQFKHLTGVPARAKLQLNNSAILLLCDYDNYTCCYT